MSAPEVPAQPWLIRTFDRTRRAIASDWVSVVSLVAVNCIPLAGVIFAGWSAWNIVWLYWVENLVVGMYTLIKLLDLPPETLEGKHRVWEFRLPNRKRSVVGLFCAHYGAFCAAHALFLLILSLLARNNAPGSEPFLVQEGTLFGKTLHFLVSQLSGGFVCAAAALFVRHGVSYVQNYLKRQEYAHLTVEQVFTSPYSRIVLLQFVILLPLLPIFAPLMFPFRGIIGSPFLIALVIGKIILDLKLHFRAHRKARTNEPPPEEA